MTPTRESVLLHLCCGPCATHSIEVLKRNYVPVLFWSDSNIHPRAEHDKRLDYAKKVAAHHGLELFVDEYAHDHWLARIAGFEQEPEGGARCAVCFRFSFERSARFAANRKIPHFTTTLSISPYKDKEVIHRAGREAAAAAGLNFLEIDFGADGGYRESIRLSKELGLYRQNYCGCEFSKRGFDH